MNQEITHTIECQSLKRVEKSDSVLDKYSSSSKASRMSSEQISKITSILARVKEITTEMRRNANSRRIEYQHTAALREACASLDPPIGLSTYYRYRTLYCVYHFGEVKDWLRYLDRSLDRKERK